MSKRNVEIVGERSFVHENLYYSKVLNSKLHPIVRLFLKLDHKRIIARYIHLRPEVDPHALQSILEWKPQHFYWSGSDLIHVTNREGVRKMLVLETNSCPSGQKSMPPMGDLDEDSGYQALIIQSFLPLLKERSLPPGDLAVLYDKNYMEASGYAQKLAEATKEEVLLIPCLDGETNHLRVEKNVLEVFHPIYQHWVPIRACLRYVTQRPWNRIPVMCKTFIYNPVLACLAGGRNKMLAAKAYEKLNLELAGSGLSINMPLTMTDVSKDQVPFWVHKLGGHAVIKVPYSNAGQGVFTVTKESELQEFMSQDLYYDQYIVQELIGNFTWRQNLSPKCPYHVGTVPNKYGEIYVSDLRLMVISTVTGLRPLCLYARRAKKPLEAALDPNVPSWDVLGTNLSIKKSEHEWDSDIQRLLLIDERDFNGLGIGIDHLIEGFIQSALCMVAIDKMAKVLVNLQGEFSSQSFLKLDHNLSLAQEIMQ